jgi:TIR domain
MSFVVGSTAIGSNFYGRKSELEAVLAHRLVWICGQRRMGKSSLLHCTAKSLRKEGWVALEFDLARILPVKANGFELFKSFLRKHRRPLKQLDIVLEDFQDLSPQEAFEELIVSIQHLGHPVAFLWDEAERLIDLNKNDPHFLDALRACLPNGQDFKFVLAGTQQLADLYPETATVSSFIGCFNKFVPLKGLSKKTSRLLIHCEQTGGWDSLLVENMVDEIYKWTGGHPLLLQEIGDRLVTGTNRCGSRADTALLRKCQQAVISNEGLRRIFSDDQQRLTTAQQAVLRSLCLDKEEQTIDMLIQSTGFEKRAVELAVAFLEDFGFVVSDEPIRLHFRFYTGFLLEKSGSSITDALKMSRVRGVASMSYVSETKSNRFSVALSFPGEHRSFVHNVAQALANKLTRERVFYDDWYEVELLGTGGDLKLQSMYDAADLVVPFFSEHYGKPWCSMEWETIRSILLKRREDDAVIPVHLDDTDIEGWAAVNFGIRLKGRSAKQIASIVLQALEHRGSGSQP